MAGFPQRQMQDEMERFEIKNHFKLDTSELNGFFL